MAITHIKKVRHLEILNNSDNIVCQVLIVIRSLDDSVEPNLKNRERLAFELDTSNITPSTSGFIQYENLTEETILSWFSSQISEHENMVEDYFDSVKNPPPPATVSKELPW
tara:strand:+ start:190 stop:522 length:333 start_codon:yes stop_codon:yes gene_type:complete